MSFTNDTPQKTPESTPEVEQSQEFLSTDEFAGQRELKQYRGSGHTTGALTSTTVLNLQRTIGNQATMRIIDKETLRRQQHSSVQRAITAEETAAIANEAKPAMTKFGVNKEAQAKKYNFAPDASSLDFKEVTLERFKTNVMLQQKVFQLADVTVANQLGKAQAAVSNNAVQGAEISALKKRKDFRGFVNGVVDKCEKKPYPTLQDMDDIARGRVNVNNETDMNSVAADLLAGGYKDFTRPRLTTDKTVTKYPRWHVILNDPTGLSFEWQIGAKATTELYEEKGIVVPPALSAAAEKAGKHLPPKADIHDISYAVFQTLVKNEDNNPAITALVKKYKVEEFVDKVNRISDKSGKLGQSNPEFKSEINSLLDEASQLLATLVADRKTSMIIKLLH